MKRLINLEMAAELPQEESKTDIVGICILDHKGSFVIVWDIFIGLLCVVSAFFYAYTSLFGIEVLYDVAEDDHVAIDKMD